MLPLVMTVGIITRAGVDVVVRNGVEEHPAPYEYSRSYSSG